VKISVLIVTFQRPELLGNCLGSLARQTRAPDEAVVVGVSGDEATRRAAEEFGAASPFRCTWRSTPRPSVVEQTNLGLQVCRGDVIAFTNDDAEPYPDWLARIEPYYADETIGGVGGRDYIHLKDGRILDGQAAQVGQVTWYGRLRGNHHLTFPAVVDVHLLKGVNMSCRHSLLRSLDARMAGGGRWHWEIDASFQIRRAGKRLVFDPQVCVDHFPGPRPPSLDPDFVYMANFNLMLNLFKYFDPWQRVAFLLYSFLWGDYPEMGLAVFSKTLLRQLSRTGDLGFAPLLPIALRAKWEALRALRSKASDG
jgi:glycosyltransferase involved in cell wall biosynthesis